MRNMQKNKCCGCGACTSICPQHAIEIKKDENGFGYPVIKKELCIDCGRCKTVCDYQITNKYISDKDTYVAVAVNINPAESSSGGLFASIAKNVLSVGGTVYGCAMLREKSGLTPKHIRVSDEESLSKLKGSKYVQSEISMIYQEVKDDLKDGLQVLFSGTPCQVAGLRGYLGREYYNLFTIDIICHGVPSAQMFQDYLFFEEKKRKKTIVDFKFRDKSDGWKLHGKMVLEDENGQRTEEFFEPEQSSYYQMFLNSYTYRENCYTCPYACDNRPGDITIGDFWCIDLVHPEMLIQNGGVFDERKGISCLIINNEQGNRMVSLYGQDIEKRESTFENAARYNGQLTHASILKPEREIALKKYSMGYAELDKWYRRRLIPIRIKRGIRAAIPRTVKNAVKHILKR